MGMGIVILTHVLLLFTTKIAADGFTYRESNESAGVMFVPTNNVQLTYEEWHLFYFYDINDYYLETKKIEECIQHLKNVCDEEAITARFATHQLCNAVVDQFRGHLGAIATKDEIIRSFQSVSHRRRRAPLEFVGGALSALFGVLDQKDALKYANEIDKLKQSSAYETELVKQQTSIVEGTIRMHNYSIAEVRQRIAEFKSDTDALKEKWFQSDSDLHLRTHFNLLSHVASLILIHHNEMAESIINLLSNTVHGKMTNLIPISRLAEKLSGIAKNLGKDQELPINTDLENVYQIFSISKINTILHDNKIMLEINFPILARDSYTLYHAISIPAPVRDKFIIISPASEYFLTDRELTKYIPIATEEHGNCVPKKGEKTLICAIQAPVQTNLADICELKLLRNPNQSVMPASCDIKEIPRRNYVIGIPNTNSYYFRIIEPITVRSLCGNNFENKIISKNGLMSIHSDCVVGNDEFTLNPHLVHTIVDERTIFPSFNIDNIVIPKYESIANKMNTQGTALIEPLRNDFNKLAGEVSLAKEKQKLTFQINDTKQHVSILHGLFAIVQVTILSVLCIVVYVVIKKPKSIMRVLQKWRKQTVQEPVDNAPVYVDIRQPERERHLEQQTNQPTTIGGRPPNDMTQPTTTSGWMTIKQEK